MTHTQENRRPVRVLPPTEVAGTPRPPASGQAADRFNRTLAGSRRTETWADKARPAAEPRAERAGAGAGADRIQRAPVALPGLVDDDTLESPPINGPADSPAPAQGADAAAHEHTAQAQDPQPRPQAPALPALAEASRWTEDTAQKVATLCTRADTSFAHWSVTLPMDAKALPETDLVLSMSPYGLSLRFRTQSSLSSQLISTHKPRLQALLARTRGLPQDIEIEVV
jgi:hypothetical protein